MRSDAGLGEALLWPRAALGCMKLPSAESDVSTVGFNSVYSGWQGLSRVTLGNHLSERLPKIFLNERVRV